MKKRHLFAAVIVVFTAASWLGSCEEKLPPENPVGEITVATGAASVSLPAVTLSGTFTGNPSDVASAWFEWGFDEGNLTNRVDAVIAGNDFSATITIDGEDYNRIGYYRGLVAGKDGATISSPDTQSFSTDYGDKLLGVKWLELPEYTISDGRVAKAYYTTMKDNSYGRNYSILYDPNYRLSRWVAFPMNKTVHLGTVSRPDPDPWAFDDSGNIPRSAQPNVIKNTYGVYAEDNFDRGHQIASADRNGSLAAMIQTFFLTNVTPQYNKLNQGVWAGLETAIRNVANGASVPAQDTLYIVTGPLLSSNPQTVKDNDKADVAIPEGYFKVILWSKYYADAPRSYDSIGFLFEENYAPNQTQGTYPNYAESVSYIEGKTGLRFFGNLELGDAEMTVIKSTSSWSDFSTR